VQIVSFDDSTPVLKDTAAHTLQDIVDRLRVATNASRTTIRLDCRALSQQLETVAAESLGDGVRSLKDEWTAGARNSAAVRWLVKNRRTFVMEDCLNPWAPEVAPEDYVIQRYGIRSELIRGVFRGDDLIGVVSVHYTPGTRSWDDAELGMIERACNEVLVTVEQVEPDGPHSETRKGIN
jgi:GAF domain-containing protein